MGEQKVIFEVPTTAETAEKDMKGAFESAAQHLLGEKLGLLAAPVTPVLGEICGKDAARQIKKPLPGIPTAEEILATKPYRRVAPEFAGPLINYINAVKNNPSLDLTDGQTIIAGRVYHDPRIIDLEFLDMEFVFLNLAYGDRYPEAHYLRLAMKAALRAWWEVLNQRYPPTQGLGVTADPHTWPRKIYLNSGYRPLGTDMTLYGDPGGINDTYDPWGHWNGYAVDIGRRETGWAFNIPGTEAEVKQEIEETGESVGLQRLRDEGGRVREKEHQHFFVRE